MSSMSIVIPTMTNITAWEFPEDAVPGEAAFLAHWNTPVETYVRAYAFTMKHLADAICEAAKTAPQHVYVDHSQSGSEAQLACLHQIVQCPGVDLTIGTSPAGKGFIAHTKAYIAVNGDFWEGSTNFSYSAWHQVNTAFQGNCPEFTDMMITAFHRDVQYAWENEKSDQLASEPPSYFVPA